MDHLLPPPELMGVYNLYTHSQQITDKVNRGITLYERQRAKSEFTFFIHFLSPT